MNVAVGLFCAVVSCGALLLGRFRPRDGRAFWAGVMVLGAGNSSAAALLLPPLLFAPFALFLAALVPYSWLHLRRSKRAADLAEDRMVATMQRVGYTPEAIQRARAHIRRIPDDRVDDWVRERVDAVAEPRP